LPVSQIAHVENARTVYAPAERLEAVMGTSIDVLEAFDRNPWVRTLGRKGSPSEGAQKDNH
jgi:hypothetical protein